MTDLLKVIEVLAALGHAKDARLSNVVDLILEKQDERGRWPLEYSYAGKIWLEFGEKKAPS